ncbi:MAG: DUF1521 domain-containing protein [Planctomycetes bacterium]|nr:DUF1521 domain-containing protein [Planctomycetota bacterium]
MTTIGERSGGGVMRAAVQENCRRGHGEDGIRRNGNVITVGNYEITIEKDRMAVRDKTTGKEFSVWGDPHLHTGDGDRASFTDDNLTLDLPGGVKITLKPTAKDANGASWIDQIGIMKGKEGMLVSDVHGNGPVFGGPTSSAEVDQAHVDGTVLSSGREIDDFHFADGREMVGGDANGRWGEHALDGRGGMSRLDFAKKLVGDVLGGASTGGAKPKSGDFYERLYAVLAKLEKLKDGALADLEDATGRKEAKEAKKGTGGGGSVGKPADDPLDKPEGGGGKAPGNGGETGNVEADIARAQGEIQRIQNYINQVTQLISNMVAQEGQNALRIVGNIRS